MCTKLDLKRGLEDVQAHLSNIASHDGTMEKFRELLARPVWKMTTEDNPALGEWSACGKRFQKPSYEGFLSIFSFGCSIDSDLNKRTLFQLFNSTKALKLIIKKPLEGCCKPMSISMV